MDSDSPAAVRTAGQPTSVLGALFTPGETHKRIGWTGRTPGDSTDLFRPYRESPASHRSPHGQGHHR